MMLRQFKGSGMKIKKSQLRRLIRESLPDWVKAELKDPCTGHSFAWIDPGGRVIKIKDTDVTNHIEWSEKYGMDEPGVRDHANKHWPMEDDHFRILQSMLELGWIRVANGLAFMVTDLVTPPTAAWQAAASLAADCVKPGDDPERKEIIIDTEFVPERYSLPDFINRYGGREIETAFWNRMMGESLIRSYIRETLEPWVIWKIEQERERKAREAEKGRRLPLYRQPPPPPPEEEEEEEPGFERGYEIIDPAIDYTLETVMREMFLGLQE